MMMSRSAGPGISMTLLWTRLQGVVYTHCSNYLTGLACASPDCMCISANSRILLMVPMFYANAWCVPYAACAAGASLVLPGECSLTTLYFLLLICFCILPPFFLLSSDVQYAIACNKLPCNAGSLLLRLISQTARVTDYQGILTFSMCDKSFLHASAPRRPTLCSCSEPCVRVSSSTGMPCKHLRAPVQTCKDGFQQGATCHHQQD